MTSPEKQSSSRMVGHDPTGVRILDLDIDKEQWKDVPPLVMAAFKNVTTNMQAIKRWSDKMEQGLLDAQAQISQKQERISKLENWCSRFQKQIQFLFVYTTSLFSRAHKRNNDQASQLQHHAEVNGSFISHFCGFFGVKPQVSSRTSTATTTSGPEDATFAECFHHWQNRKTHEERQVENMTSSIEELRVVSDRTRERMLAWRDIITENAHMMEAFSATSITTQNELQILKGKNVPLDHIQSMIQEAREQVETQVSTVTESIEEMQEKIVEQEGNLVQQLRDTSQEMQQRMSQHGVEMIGVMESNINPMSSYLNSMHVKADAMQQQLNMLDSCIPEIEAKLDFMSEGMKHQQDDQLAETQRSDELREQLLKDIDEQNTQMQREKYEWAAKLEDSSQEVHERLEQLNSSVQQIRDGLQSLEKGRFEKMTQALGSLNQKVTTWISNNSLPAKISEARLYALEAKLNEETKNRFKLESRLSLFESGSMELGETPLPSTQSMHGLSPPLQSDSIGEVVDLNSEVSIGDLPAKQTLPGIDGKRSPSTQSKESANITQTTSPNPPAKGGGWSRQRLSLAVGRGTRQVRREQAHALRGQAIGTGQEPKTFGIESWVAV